MEDHYTPKRFFSFHTDEQVKYYAARYFEQLSLNRIDLEEDVMHYQGMTLRRTLILSAYSWYPLPTEMGVNLI